MTKKAWPILGLFIDKERAGLEAHPCAGASSSTIRAGIAPFTRRLAASCLRAPLWGPWWDCRLSSAQSSGIALPSSAATMSLPRATSDNDRSIESGGPSRLGKTAAIGLVVHRVSVG
jgi:hypothetical protein